MGKFVKLVLEVMNVALWSLFAVELCLAQAALVVLWLGDRPMAGGVMFVAWGLSIMACVGGERLVSEKIGRAIK
jgi:hypothetical protein